MILRLPMQGPPAWALDWAVVIAALAPIITLLVVLVAYLAYLQRARADKRDQWWKRAQWGIESALSNDPARQEVGVIVLDNLDRSGLATREDAALFSEVALSVLEEKLDQEYDLATAGDPGARMERKEATVMSKGEARTARQAKSERNKALEEPSPVRNIKVTLASDGGRIIYVSDPARARVLERADKFLTRERNYKK